MGVKSTHSTKGKARWETILRRAKANKAAADKDSLVAVKVVAKAVVAKAVVAKGARADKANPAKTTPAVEAKANPAVARAAAVRVAETKTGPIKTRQGEGSANCGPRVSTLSGPLSSEGGPFLLWVAPRPRPCSALARFEIQLERNGHDSNNRKPLRVSAC